MKRGTDDYIDDPRFNDSNETYEVNLDFGEDIEGNGSYPVDEPLVVDGICMGNEFVLSQRPSDDLQYHVDHIDLVVERGGRYWVMRDAVDEQEANRMDGPVPLQSPYAGQESDVFRCVMDYEEGELGYGEELDALVWTPDGYPRDREGELLYPQQHELSSTRERVWRDRVVSELAELWRSVKETAGMAVDERNMDEDQLEQTRRTKGKAKAFLQYRRG